MPATGWFYTRGAKRFGPISAAELKQLADHGELGPDELVWREGLEQWVAARRVKGLFDQQDPTQPKEEIPLAAPPKAEAAASGVESPKRVEPATPPAPPASQLMASGPIPAGRLARAAFEASASAFERARQGAPRHLFDALLEAARTTFNAQFVAATAALFAAIGHYTLYAAMVLLLGTELAIGVRYGSLWAMLLGFVGMVLLAVLQYAAGRMAGALERLDRATVSRMPSPVFLDCCALVSFLAGLAALVGWTVYAVLTQDFGWVLPAVIGFIVFQYLAVVALNPESLFVAVTGDASAGEEAIAVLSVLVKMGLRAAPVVFGVGVLWGTFLLLYAIALLAVPAFGERLAPDLGPDLLTRWIVQGSNLPAAQGTAVVGAALLTLSAATPLLAYLAFLSAHLLLEVLRAVLALPGKLENVAESRKSGDLMP